MRVMNVLILLVCVSHVAAVSDRKFWDWMKNAAAAVKAAVKKHLNKPIVQYSHGCATYEEVLKTPKAERHAKWDCPGCNCGCRDGARMKDDAPHCWQKSYKYHAYSQITGADLKKCPEEGLGVPPHMNRVKMHKCQNLCNDDPKCVAITFTKDGAFLKSATEPMKDMSKEEGGIAEAGKFETWTKIAEFHEDASVSTDDKTDKSDKTGETANAEESVVWTEKANENIPGDEINIDAEEIDTELCPSAAKGGDITSDLAKQTACKEACVKLPACKAIVFHKYGTALKTVTEPTEEREDFITFVLSRTADEAVNASDSENGKIPKPENPSEESAIKTEESTSTTKPEDGGKSEDPEKKPKIKGALRQQTLAPEKPAAKPSLSLGGASYSLGGAKPPAKKKPAFSLGL